MKDFFDNLRFSVKKFFLLWKGGMMFLVVVMAAVLAAIAHSGTVFVEVLLFSMFLGVLWFFPLLRDRWVVRAVVGMVFLYILANIVLGDNLFNSLERFSGANKDRAAIALDRKTNSLRHLRLKNGTPLFIKRGVGGFSSVTYSHPLVGDLEVIDLGKKIEDNGIIYAKVLFPRRGSSGLFVDGVFDSTSESWWVQAETIRASPALQKKDLKSLGWRDAPAVPYSCFYNGKEVAVTGVPLPPEMAGKAVVFRRFRWTASFTLENGRCRIHYTSPGVEEAVHLDKSNYPLLLSIDGRVPDKIWWRPLDLVTQP